MILRRAEHFYLPPARIILLLLLCAATVYCDDAESDCKFSINGKNYDLSSLAGEHTVNRTRELPPSTMVDSLVFNLCGEITEKEETPEAEQCPKGTRACLITVNQRLEQPERIISVVPLAQTSLLQPSYSAQTTPKGVSVILHGPEHQQPGNETRVQQSLSVTVLCDQEVSTPRFLSYNGSQAIVDWLSPSGCAQQESPGDDKPDGSSEGVGSGLGWFFLVLLLAFAAYFGLGAYYNYTNYGATGLDLIPHRDFWQEVPYMVQDVISHLCSNVGRRRSTSRGGYIAV